MNLSNGLNFGRLIQGRSRYATGACRSRSLQSDTPPSGSFTQRTADYAASYRPVCSSGPPQILAVSLGRSWAFAAA